MNSHRYIFDAGSIPIFIFIQFALCMFSMNAGQVCSLKLQAFKRLVQTNVNKRIERKQLSNKMQTNMQRYGNTLKDMGYFDVFSMLYGCYGNINATCFIARFTGQKRVYDLLVPFFESDCKKVTDAYFNRPIKQDSIINLDGIFIEQTIKNMRVWRMLGACGAANIHVLKIMCRYHMNRQETKELKRYYNTIKKFRKKIPYLYNRSQQCLKYLANSNNLSVINLHGIIINLRRGVTLRTQCILCSTFIALQGSIPKEYIPYISPDVENNSFVFDAKNKKLRNKICCCEKMTIAKVIDILNHEESEIPPDGELLTKLAQNAADEPLLETIKSKPWAKQLFDTKEKKKKRKRPRNKKNYDRKRKKYC